MNKLESAELKLRRAKDEYDAAVQEAQQQQPPQAPQAPQPPADTVRCDLDKIETIQDIVAVVKTMGLQIHFDRNNPNFATVEHLVVDDEPETPDAPE